MRATFAEFGPDWTWDLVIDGTCYSEAQAAILYRLISGRTRRLIVISSTIMYSSDQSQPIAEDGLLSPPAVIGTYGIGKLAIENLWLSAFPESGIAPTVLRLPHVLGAGAELGAIPLHNRDPFIVSRIRQRKPILLVDGGRQLIQIVFNEDVARVVFDIAHREQTFGQIYNCCNPTAVPAYSYYREIARHLGVELSVSGIEYEALAQSSWGWLQTAQSRLFSSEKLHEHADIVCRTPLADAIRETLRHLLDRGIPPDDPLEDELMKIDDRVRSGRAELAAVLTHAGAIRRRTPVDKRMNG